MELLTFLFMCTLCLACLEGALGTFYAPSHPLTEGAIIQFRDDISRIARKFFHHLLRLVRSSSIHLIILSHCNTFIM